jgi:murein DD-endopeptidase MepM/ murein hydrolase activator NlpD
MNYIYPTASRTVSDSFADHVDRGSVNPGTDYVLAAGGEVRSIAAGKVVVADGNPDGSGGRTITVYHDDGSSADYLHLNALSVSVGQRVAQGQRLGFSGGSGYGKNDYYGAHLHITFRPHNQIDWLGNVGNVDFDALMKTTTSASTAQQLTTNEGEDDVAAIVMQHPKGQMYLFGDNGDARKINTMDEVASLVQTNSLRRVRPEQPKLVDQYWIPAAANTIEHRLAIAARANTGR